MEKIIIFIIIIIFFMNVFGELREAYEWKQVTFLWPSDSVRRSAIRNGEYIPENNMPMGLARWHNKMFITLPRWKRGVAATLTYINMQSSKKSPTLIPYPSFESNRIPNGRNIKDDVIISTFRVQVDVCDRLWVIDSGSFDFFNNTKQVSPPSILIFDLNTDTLLRKYYLADGDVACDGSSVIPDIIVDVTRNTCNQAFAYLPDLGGYGLIVYSFAENRSWRISHNFFHMDPNEGDLWIGGINIQWNDGIFGVALGDTNARGFRKVYFHSMISTHEYSVSSEVLRNETMATSSNNYNLFKHEGNRGRRSQASPSDYDRETSVLFMNQLQKDAIACWNTNKKLDENSFTLIEQDHERLEFINDIYIDQNRNLWVLSDRMTKFLYGNLNPNDVNYRILYTTVDRAIRGTSCEYNRL
ncbi:protein yellow-like [Diorhabda carinulata]|uniref:protein yellow-like n=1 Tax=Diorhabda carinulata TaxID=1163345 RepID=UPI0025A1F05A|nr:protein yellow-like [Diorhabda carinulata]